MKFNRKNHARRCNVCKAEFRCAPPTRHELMQSFTGPELGALIEVGCMIGAHEAFTGELRRQLEGMPSYAASRSSYLHWAAGAYLITQVQEAETSMEVPVASAQMLELLRSRPLRWFSGWERAVKAVPRCCSVAGFTQSHRPGSFAA